MFKTQSLKKKNYTSVRDMLATRCHAPTAADHRLLQSINERCDSLASTSDQGLREQIGLLQDEVAQLPQKAMADHVLVRSLSLAKQALIRTSGMTAYDVQLLAGIAMSRGAIVEMQTGEGKTLTSTFPIVAHALTRRGVHVATVNGYLTQRDFEFVAPALQLLGLTVGISNDGESADAKRKSYACDVTFSTGYEFGFDFLRDQISLMSRGPDRLGENLKRQLFSQDKVRPNHCQRGHAVAIIDEIDSVLIDEATTPLVLSSGSLNKLKSSAVKQHYHRANEIALDLQRDHDFVVDDQAKTVFLTQAGSETIHAVPPNHVPEPRATFDMLADLDMAQVLVDQQLSSNHLVRPWQQYIESALRAQHTMRRDINYIVHDGKVKIVDEYTGRIFSDRNWRAGLHQAVEAKEGVEITEEKRTLARISRQRYFQRYGLLCGMTGTVSGHQREMFSCYQLPVVAIPRRKQSRQCEIPTRYFSSERRKISAVVTDAVTRHQSGQPILIGTRTIQQTLQISQALAQQAVPHQVLNGVQDADEALLIAAAGRPAAITVATNMAGRGTDINLQDGALGAGGLHVIGFERNHSRRIDRQLLGRAGRQGDPGSGQFFVSADDEIVKRFATSLERVLASLCASRDGQPNPSFDKQISKAQQTAEKESQKQRENVMREELWLDDVKKAVNYQ